jgi:homoserine/homoserine lactone efflux protein
MSIEGWFIFATFWVLFVTTPGPNAVNCIQTAIDIGFRKSLICVLGILTQACLFLGLSAVGVSALISTSPLLFEILRWSGVVFLIWLGIRNWMQAGRPRKNSMVSHKTLYVKAFLIAAINPKSLAGYIAAFSQFVETDVPIGTQMWVIVPTALILTTLSYTGYCALGAHLGRRALDHISNFWIQRILAACFVAYGILLGLAAR